MAAALSSTEGTDCSRASVPLARGTRCGLRGCCEGDGSEMGSMSRSKMADEEECLQGKKNKNTLSTGQKNNNSEIDTHRSGRGWNGVGRTRAQAMVTSAGVLWWPVASEDGV